MVLVALAATGCTHQVSQPISTDDALANELAGAPKVPPTLESLQEIPAAKDSHASVEGMPEVRVTALRSAAQSFGARGGLAWRSHEINQMLDRQAGHLDQVYVFNALTLRASDGSTIEPPVITQGERAYAVSPDGQSQTTAKRVYRIVQAARIRPTMPNWRGYLTRTWQYPAPPPPLLLPRSDTEREAWRKWVAEGWQAGIQQADAIFDSDLGLLKRDFTGMARYRRMVALGLVNELYIAEADRGVTGGGNELKIGDRVVRITAPAKLNNKSEEWKPILLDEDL